jgi:hypothetical protein
MAEGQVMEVLRHGLVLVDRDGVVREVHLPPPRLSLVGFVYCSTYYLNTYVVIRPDLVLLCPHHGNAFDLRTETVRALEPACTVGR